MPATSSGGPPEIRHKLEVLRRHCEDVGRDPAEIEVTAMYRHLPRGASVAEVVKGAEALASVGVSTLVTAAMTNDPAGFLEDTFGPAMADLAAIEPSPL
jgi:alkanesulfonate monooxygenase SsuD/methylene tetrahydromethanopterin reductase-like flavin-dependent oxidoreductase (luciferase family)